MKTYAWLFVGVCAIGGFVACGQQLVDLPFEQDEADMGEVDLSVPVVETRDMAPGERRRQPRRRDRLSSGASAGAERAARA